MPSPRVRLLLSLLLLAGSAYTLIYSSRWGTSLATYLHKETPAERQARDDRAHADTLLYAQRLRADAVERASKSDFENAQTRLDEAAELDPAGDKQALVVETRSLIAREPHLDPSALR